jgi:undecaprenyl-diphosphatase
MAASVYQYFLARLYYDRPAIVAAVDWIEALVLGILQGLTEWLPVSSSGHLALAQRYLGEVPVVIDILLHFGTMLVLFMFFRKDVRLASRSALAALADLARGKGWEASVRSNTDRRMAFCIVLALVPTAVIALIFRFGIGPQIMDNIAIVATGFAITGVLLLATSFAANKRAGNDKGRGLDRLETSDALTVGTAQGIAFLPGFSRSGLTIGTGLFRGMDAETAGRYSFLISLPAVLGATILELPDAVALPGQELLMGLAGMAVAMVVGYASLGALMRILKKGNIAWFSPYCFVMCGVTVAILFNII